MSISKIFCPVTSAVSSTCKKVNGDKERLLDTEAGFQLCCHLTRADW